MKHYLLLKGEVKGPFSLVMIREMLAAGVIQDTHLMAQEGGNAWQPVGLFLSSSLGCIDAACCSETAGRSTISNTALIWHRRRKIWVTAVAVFLIAIIYKGLNRAEVGSGETSNDNPSQASQYRGQEDNGTEFRAANRRTVREFDGVLEITAGVGGNSGVGELEVVLAAVDNTNWNACGPDLRNAALAVKNIRNGDSKVETMEKVQRFADLCNKYR